jgi:pimeloyl-ACP methyl ester carboxylesterase
VAFESSQITRSVTRVAGFRDAEFDYQLLRAMGVAAYGGSTVGECLAAAAMIVDGDTRSWVRLFGELADRVEELARHCLTAGRLVSARDHLLRASTYHRTAAYYAEDDPVVLEERGRRSSDCFASAAGLFEPPVEVVSIPFEDGALPGYLIHPPSRALVRSGPRRTLVALGGFDASAEELYFQLGAPGASRGWQVLVFDGPGHAGYMRLNPGVAFRPDYDAPVGAAVDFVTQLAGETASRVVLAGLSHGAFFAAQAAARDRRVGALVLDSPVVDLFRYFEAMIGPEVFRMRRDIRPEDVAGVPWDLLPAQMVWGISAVCRRFGVGSLHEWLRRLDSYRLGDEIGAIRCPTLALWGAHEGPEVERQARAFAASAGGPVTEHPFPTGDGADSHCQVGNLRLTAQVVYDWLEDAFVPGA